MEGLSSNQALKAENRNRRMQELTLSIIGAGSSYTPEILEGLVQRKHAIPVAKLIFMDIDPRRLDTAAAFCRRYLRHLGHEIPIITTTDMRAAVGEAQFIVTEIRVGGNRQRALDEKIPLKYGIIGQETTGPGGMFKAFRTIPALVDLARIVESANPEAWIINYTNPTGMVTEAVQKVTKVKIVGLCSGGYFPRDAVSKVLGVAKEEVYYDYFGLNHLNFAYNISIHGRPLTDAEFDLVAERVHGGLVDKTLIKNLRLIPSPYLQYYYHHDRRVAEVLEKGTTRAEIVQAVEKEVFAAYADPAQETKPDALKKRGGGGYSEIALEVIDAILNNRGRSLIVNTSNQGAIRFLPDDAVVEINSLVNAAGIHPLSLAQLPRSVWGLVAAVKNYEQLAVDAALRGDRDLALQALLAHPLVGQMEIAAPLLDEMLAANRAFLPQFFGA